MKRPRLVRDLGALLAGDVASKIAGFAAFAWLARVLTPAAYGSVELAAAMVLFFGLAVDFGLAPIGAREIARERDRAAGLVRTIPALRGILAMFTIPAMGLAAWAIGQPPEAVRLVWLFAFSLLFAPFTQDWMLQGLDRMSWVSVVQPLRMAVFVAGVVLLVRTPADLLRVGGVQIAAAGAVSAYYLVTQRALGLPLLPSFRGVDMRNLVREALPVGAAQIVWALNQYLPIVMVAALLDPDSLAFFGGAHRIIVSLGGFITLYHFNLYPTLARRVGQGREAVAALVEPSFRVTAWAGVGAALALGMLAGPLVRLAYGAAFAPAAAPLAVLAWVLPVSLLSGHARFALIAAGHQTQELVAQLAGSVVMVAGCLLAIPLLGPVGAGVAMVAAGAVVWGVAHRFAAARVASLPSLGPVWRPVLAAGLALLAALGTRRLGAVPPLLPAGAALLAFALAAFVLDSRLLRDLHRLAGAKGEEGAALAAAASGEVDR